MTTNSVNVDGTIRLMVEAAGVGVRRVIVASSSAVYGDAHDLPSRESQRADPRSPYATSKLAMEHYAHNIGASNGVETVALRYFNVFGPAKNHPRQSTRRSSLASSWRPSSPTDQSSMATGINRVTSRSSKTSSPPTCSQSRSPAYPD